MSLCKTFQYLWIWNNIDHRESPFVWVILMARIFRMINWREREGLLWGIGFSLPYGMWDWEGFWLITILNKSSKMRLNKIKKNMKDYLRQQKAEETTLSNISTMNNRRWIRNNNKSSNQKIQIENMMTFKIS